MISNTALQHFKLKNIPTEDLEDVLTEVETSFGVQFESGEFMHIGTLGELCKYMAEKLMGECVIMRVCEYEIMCV